MLIEEDLTQFNVQELPYVDVFLAGVPCQSFSSLGNKHRDDARNDLYKIPLKYAWAKKPQYFIFENVPQFKNTEFFPRLVRALKRIYTFVEHAVLNAAEFGSIQRRKRLIVVGSDIPFRLPRGCVPAPPLVSSVLDPPLSNFKYLSDKWKAYLRRRSRWGVKIYKRGDRAFLGTLPRSYGHMQCWRHTIDEGGGRLRDLTPSEAFRVQSFDPGAFDLTGLSRRQRMYLAGNAIDRRMLTALFEAVIIS